MRRSVTRHAANAGAVNRPSHCGAHSAQVCCACPYACDIVSLAETICHLSGLLQCGQDFSGIAVDQKRFDFCADTPAESQPLAGLQQQSAFMMGPSSGDSPILNNHAGLEEVQAALPQLQTISNSSSSKGGKNSPAQRHGPCGHCKTPYSPQWRKGPRNKPVLCNACGIRYLRNRHLGRSVVGAGSQRLHVCGACWMLFGLFQN
jgi:hypothetical protein